MSNREQKLAMPIERPIDVLIQWAPKGSGTRIFEPAPDVSERTKLTTLMGRYRGMHPIMPDAAARFIVKICVSGSKPDLLYKMGYGLCLMADRVKAIFDEFVCPGLEYAPVDAFMVPTENAALKSGVRGTPVEEQYWIMNCYNFHDVIDHSQTVGNWKSHRQWDLDNRPDYYGPDDPAELYNPEHIVLKSVPDDAIFGIAGLSRDRFVSEALFQRFIESGLFDPRWELPFTLFNLIASEQGWGGNRASIPVDQRRPHKLNGRALYWGNLKQPLDFPRDGEY